MGSLQSIQTITALAAGGNFDARDINITINPTTSTPAATKPRSWNSFCTVDAPTPNFTGHKDLIATIHRQIQQCSLEKEYSKKIVVIHGLGGMGKTELVRKYVQLHRQDPFILNAAWIDAQNKNSLEDSFMSLAGKLDVKTKDKKIKDVVYSIYDYLAEHSQPSLFIFDNAEQMRSEDDVFGIFDFLPTVQLHSIPLIIITTRVNNWEIPENPENIIQINELSEKAGIEFLTKRFKLSSKQKRDKAIMDALKNLARNLQCFPLGLTLAASNIPHTKLRCISKDIEDYIQKLHFPHGDWIHDQHSSGTASNYDLIMNNVWAATLEKIQSHGHDGEAAISVLNIIAYFPPDKITVEDVVEVAEFSGLPNSTAGVEMLELYSLISLPPCTYDCIHCRFGKHQPIRIHRLVQRCTRDKLDRENNYTYLLNIAVFWVNVDTYPVHGDERAVHQHLKERMWPENSITFSILLASQDIFIDDAFEMLKDVHEVFVLKKKPGYAQNLTQDCKILHELNLFHLSACSRNYRKLCEDLISANPSYSKNYLEKAFLLSLCKCFQGLFMGNMDMEDLVNRATFEVLIKTFACDLDTKLPLLLSERTHEEISSMLADTTSNSFEGRVETVRQLYRLLSNICWAFKPISGSWYVESVLKIHGSVYASISKTGGDRLDSY